MDHYHLKCINLKNNQNSYSLILNGSRESSLLVEKFRFQIVADIIIVFDKKGDNGEIIVEALLSCASQVTDVCQTEMNKTNKEIDILFKFPRVQAVK